MQIIKSGQARGYKDFDFTHKYYLASADGLDERQLQKGDILINSTGVGTAGRVTLFDLDGLFVADSHITILRLDQKRTLPGYVLYALAHIGFKNIEAMANGASGQIELPLSTIERIKIPLPPLAVQQQIVAEIEAIEAQEAVDKQQIQECREEMEQVMENMPGTPTPVRSLAQINPPKDEVAKLPADSLVSFIDMASLSNEGGITHNEDRPLSAVQKGYTYFREGDVLFAKITPCMENGKGALAIGLTNKIGFGSTEFFVIRPNGLLKAELLYRFLQRRSYRAEAEKVMTGASGHRRVPKTFLENTLVNVPSPAEQETLAIQLQNLENRIREAQARLAGVAGQKAEVLKRYL
ncbi:restriction endonuclease subunit S [Spirosoma montaniterrae]|uniref:Type I restriction modification DNA specificity domain-containing protein n=1 Tax=Spirosoma montaniterrae TaxID=1178516 RepID=A0A1P9X2I0_9BACT|nr:restriction endonuclease subunit S [Spirosoma montaniterrae]AQG81836.1 hypothetical protein AWR27_22540 [Spirosoma montaniterrae]